jgi:hypothetical protein
MVVVMRVVGLMDYKMEKVIIGQLLLNIVEVSFRFFLFPQYFSKRTLDSIVNSFPLATFTAGVRVKWLGEAVQSTREPLTEDLD